MTSSISQPAEVQTHAFRDLLSGTEKLPGSAGLDRLSKFGLEKNVTSPDIEGAIREDARRKGWPSEAQSEIVKNAMDYFGSGDDATVGRLRLLNRVVIRGVYEQSGPVKVASFGNADNGTEIRDGFKKMFGFNDSQEFELFATAALGGVWDIDVSKTDGDHDGMIKVAFTNRNDPDAQFEFFLDQANKRILWGDALAKRAPHGDPLLKQVAELLTTLVRRSVDCASNDNALQKAVLSVDKGFDQSRLDSLFIEDVIERTDRFEVVLQDDTGAQEEVDRRLAAMFPEDFEGLRDFANAKLNGSWDVGVSKVGGVDQGKVQVVFTDRSNKGTQFEFILDQANKRILCGDNFAKWAADGDPRAEQMTKLLTALGRGSRKNAEGNNALDRVEFKPGDVDTYALLKKGYGRSCKRGRYLLIMNMASAFQGNKTTFEELMSENLKRSERKAKRAYEKLEDVDLDNSQWRAVRAYQAINKIADKVLNPEIPKTEQTTRRQMDGDMVKMLSLVNNGSHSRTKAVESMIALSNTEYDDPMKIASYKEGLLLDKAATQLDPESQLKRAIDAVANQRGKSVPLGLVLLEYASRFGPNLVLWDAYETREAPKALPAAEPSRVIVRHPPPDVNG